MKATFAIVFALAAAGAACSKAKETENQLPPLPAGEAAPGAAAASTATPPAPTAPGAAPGAEAPGDPHAGLGLDPHGGGAPAAAVDPHGGAGPGPGGATLAKASDGRVVLGPFLVTPPAGWEERPTSSSMRAAEWRLPGTKGAEDAELVVYYFGAGGAGGVEANVNRWLGQFTQADGTPSKAKAKVEAIKVAGQKATMVEVAGHYVAAVRPGAPETMDKQDWKLLAAIVESPAGAYYFKLVGPQSTVDGHAAAFKKMVGKLVIAP